MKWTRPGLLALALASCGEPPAPPKAPPVVPNDRPVPAPPSGVARLSSADVDRAIRASWEKAGITPAARADDATYLRRVTLDVIGRPPTPEEIESFVADRAADKRAKKVDALLASPEYARHFANVWEEILVGNEVREQRLDRQELRKWLLAQFQQNTPWDKVVAGLVAATGRNSEGGPRNALPMELPAEPAPMAPRADDTARAATGPGTLNGAVNYTLRFQGPQDLAGSASRTFLGVQIQCAQCHDHKTEKWKQDDFRKFTAAFLRAEVDVVDKGDKGGIRRVDLVDSARVPPRFVKAQDLAPIAAATPTALDGTPLDKGKDTRRELAAWMTSPKNPWFAKAYVNRVWAHFLGRGFQNPVDDMRPSNPTTLPELLERIARDFADGGFDPKALVRLVCGSEVYALEARGGTNVDTENLTWARFRMVPLGPEELLAHLFAATRVERAAEAAGIKNLPTLKAQLAKSYAFLFDVDEVEDSKTFEGNVTQALSLLNGNVTGYGTRALPGTALAEVLSRGTDAEKVQALYLRTVHRRATEAEVARAVAYLDQAEKLPEPSAAPAPGPAPSPPGKGGKGKKKAPSGDAAQLARLAAGRAGASADGRTRAFEDLFWALLTSSESLLNH